MNPAADSADLAPAERLHPLIILTGLGGSLRGVAGGYAGVGYLAATGRLDTALLAGGALLLFLVVGLVLYWRRFEYRVGAHEIRIDSGIVSRTHRSIPFDRVQDVDLEQGFVARLLGLAKVKFETGGSAASGAEEGVLPAIALHRAEALRDHVRSRRGVVPVATDMDEGEPPPIYAMDLRRLLTAGLFNFSLAVFAGLAGATQTLGDVIGFDPFERAFWDKILTGNPLVAYAGSHRIAAVAAGLVLLGLLGLATGLVRTILREWGFRLDRSGNGLRRRRGLLTRTDVTLPIRRVQAAALSSGPLRERLGWTELRFQGLASDGAGRGGGDHVVAPLARRPEADRILAELGWRQPAPQARWERFASYWVTSLALKLAPFAVMLAALVLLLTLLPLTLDPVVRGEILQNLASTILIAVALLLAMALGVASRWLAWRRGGFILGGDRLAVRTGWWRRHDFIVPLDRVQSVELIDNALSRRFGVASLLIGIAAGRGASLHLLPALDRERASQVRDLLLSRSA